RREFAPYIGLNWSKKLGETADLVKAAGGDTDDTQWVAGIRAWF
ncbi:MAG: copper resistance protein B, partial [Gammaproteobacteria bacterium]|nr:copper resistance protein B [Gammaproteobacteria bacterium]